MKGIRHRWLLMPIMISAMAMAAPLQAEAQTLAATERPAKSSKSKRTQQSNGHVYLLRGLLNIFSLGMDDLASKIQARGISATVHNHSEWQALADGIAAQYKARQHGPIVLVGHSLGADAVMFMAEYLGKRGVPVALVVPFDGTGSFAASSNIGQVYNLTQRDYAHMRRGPGFRGQLNNVDVSGQGYGHIDIDKSARLHALVIGRIQSVIRTRARPVEQAAPAPRVRPAAQPDAESPPSAKPASADSPAVAPAAPAKPAAEAAPAAVAPAAKPEPATTTASANAAATTPSDHTASVPPAVSRPATVSTEPRARRTPASSGTGATKPELRF